MATLTYVYAEQTAVLGPLATFAEPHTYDLCAFHAERLTAPQGWELVRLSTHFEEQPETDDLLAVADALRPAQESPAPDLPGMGGYGAETVEGNGTDGPGGPRPARLRVLRDGRA